MTQPAQGLGVVAFPTSDALPGGVTSGITGLIPTTDSTPYPPQRLSLSLSSPASPFTIRKGRRGGGCSLEMLSVGQEHPVFGKMVEPLMYRCFAFLVRAILTPT